MCTLPEIERVFDLVLGANLKLDHAHILSMHALTTVLDHPEDFNERLQTQLEAASQSPFDAYVIEHSSAKVYSARTSSGPVLVDSMVARNLAQKRSSLTTHYDAGRLLEIDAVSDQCLSSDEMKASMRRIRNRLNAPILWVFHHGLPTPKPHETPLAVTRANLAAHTCRFARQMSADFYDPTQIVAALGRENAFRAGGQDLYHVTRSASMRLSRILTAWRRKQVAAVRDELDVSKLPPAP